MCPQYCYIKDASYSGTDSDPKPGEVEFQEANTKQNNLYQNLLVKLQGKFTQLGRYTFDTFVDMQSMFTSLQFNNSTIIESIESSDIDSIFSILWHWT
ncbi:MAG: hypothetical protein WCF95_07585, partial [bacterium]